MAYEFIQVDRRGGVLVVTMHDPSTRNALGQEMAREIFQELDRFDDDPEDRVLLITGTEPSFCSGANVKEFNRDIEERRGAAEESPLLPWGKMEARLGSREESGQVPGKPSAIEDSSAPETLYSCGERPRDGL